MNSASSKQPIWVGLFSVVALLVLAGAILMIGTLRNTFTSKIGVTAVFEGVEGLQSGDNIWYSGMKVGTVKSLQFTETSQVRVDLRIDESAAPYIHSDVKATIGSDGLIGNRIVVLEGGTPEAATLKEGDQIAVGETVSTDDLMATLQENNTNLLAITKDIKSITEDLAAGEGSLGQLLKDDTLFASLSDTSAKLNKASENAQRLTASLTTFSAKLNQEGTLPNQLVSDTTTYPAVKDTIGNLNQASQKADELVAGLKAETDNPNSALGTLISDDEAGADLRATLDNLNESTQLLKEDLKALQSTWILRRALRKQRRAEGGE